MHTIDFQFAHVDTPISDRRAERWGRVEDFVNDGRCVKVIWFDQSGFEVYSERAVRDMGLKFWER